MNNGVVTLPKLTRYNNEMKETVIFINSIKGCQAADIDLPNGQTVQGVKIYTSPTDYFKSPISPKSFASACAHALKTGEAVTIDATPEYLALTDGKASKKALKTKY